MSLQGNSRTIVIDNGSKTCKAGFSGDQSPSFILNTIIGYDNENKTEYISTDAYIRADQLDIQHPIENRTITNYESIEKIWNYIIHNQFKTESSNHSILMTDDALNTKANREKMIQIMFETFNIPSFYVANQSVLSLYSAGRLNGVVIDSGDSMTLAAPIYGGYYISNTGVSSPIAGKIVTDSLLNLLNEKGFNFNSFSQRETVGDIKEKLCFLARDFDSEIKKNESFVDYKLPDGNVINVGKEAFKAAEVLFHPKIGGFEENGIDEILIESIGKCDEKIQNELYSNIVVSGGTSKLNNFVERLKTEVNKHAPVCVNVIEPHKRQFAPWIGGSLLSSLPTFKDMMVSSQEYNESGPSIVRKCP